MTNVALSRDSGAVTQLLRVYVKLDTLSSKDDRMADLTKRKAGFNNNIFIQLVISYFLGRIMQAVIETRYQFVLQVQV